MRVGVQLYSIRKEIEKNGLDTVLGEVKAAGFDYVETAGFYGLSPEEFAASLKKAGLVAMSAHEGIETDKMPYIKALGIKKIYVPWMDEQYVKNPEKKSVVSDFIKRMNDEGIEVGYHNHSHEYSGGVDLVKMLLDDHPKLSSQLDLFWVTVAGWDAKALIKSYGRVTSIHIKEPDMKSGGDPTKLPNCVPGTGGADMAGMVKTAVDAGVTDFVLEVEGFPFDYREYLTQSRQAIEKLINQ